MRRLVMTAVALAALAGLAACDGSTPETAEPGAPAAPAAETPAAAAPTLADLPAPYNEASLENGAATFIKCRNCHSLKPEEGNKVGPNLHGVFDRHPGTQDKFKYSPAVASYDAERWTPEHIDGWLTNPKEFLPGSSMFFNGIEDPLARRDVIAYLLIESRK